MPSPGYRRKLAAIPTPVNKRPAALPARIAPAPELSEVVDALGDGEVVADDPELAAMVATPGADAVPELAGALEVALLVDDIALAW